MAYDPRTAPVDDAPLIHPVPLDDLLAAYDDWDEADDAFLDRITPIDTAIKQLQAALGNAGLRASSGEAGPPLVSGDAAIAALDRLRADLAQAIAARALAHEALDHAHAAAEASLERLRELRLARVATVCLALLLALVSTLAVLQS